MTQRKKSQNMGFLMIVLFSAVFLWALTAVLWPVPVVYAQDPEIITITVTSNLETYFYDPGLDPTGGTVYFNSLAGEGAGQVLTVTVTCSGTVTRFEGAPAFDDTPPPDNSAPWEITYTVEMGAETQNGIVFTVTNALSQTDTAVITFTQDITDPTIVSPTINEDSDYLYADALTLYYSDLMNGTPQSFTVQGNATDNDGAGLDQATFSSAFGVTPPADDDPANWNGTYDDVESGDNGDGTITVTVTDNVGNWSEQTFDYTEDTTNPTVTLTYVTPGGYDEDDPDDWLDADGSNWYDPDNLSAGWYFTSTVTDILSGPALANASWDHFNDAYDQLTYDPGLDGDGVFNGVSDDGDGVVTVTLTITDQVGNAASDTVVLNLDNTAPTIISPYIYEWGSEYLHVVDDLTVYYGDDMGSPEDFEVRGYAEDAGAGPYQATYPLLFDDQPLPDNIIASPHFWAGDYDVYQGDCCDGTITVTVSDRVGNSTTQIFTYTIDIISPTISYGSPPIVENSPHDALYADGTKVYYSDQMGGTAQSFTVQGNAADNSGGAGLHQATFSSAFGVTPPADDDPATWSGTYDDVESSDNGDGTITVTVYDNVGNWSEKTFDYIEDTTNPTVNLTYVTPGGYDEDDPDDWLDADGSNWYNDGDFTAGGNGWQFTSDTSDGGGGAGLDSGTAYWDHSGQPERPLNCGPGGDGTFSGVTGDPDGAVTVTITIADHVGNSASDTVLFSIDNTEPTITSPYIDDYGRPRLHVDELTVYCGDMTTTPQSFDVRGDANDNADGVGLHYAAFSSALGGKPDNDDSPDHWAGTYTANSDDTYPGMIIVTVYDRLGNAADETFYYQQDITPPMVDVTCPAVSSDPSWSVSWNSSSDPPPNASGLKHFDVQFSEVSSDGPWQNWHTDTDSTEDTFGPTSPVIVEDDHTYYFRVRAEDNVSNESSYTNGQDATLYHSGIKKVFLPILWAPDPNWGFETGDFTSWQHGGQLAQSVSTAMPHSGNYSALLGSPGYACEGGVPVGSAWLSRNVTVPSSGSPTLSFWYKIYTQDQNSSEPWKYDYFAVYINGSDLVVKDANITLPYGCSTTHIFKWKYVTFPLGTYKGQTIQITFYNYNRGSQYPEWYNTYTYVDDVSVQ